MTGADIAIRGGTVGGGGAILGLTIGEVQGILGLAITAVSLFGAVIYIFYLIRKSKTDIHVTKATAKATIEAAKKDAEAAEAEKEYYKSKTKKDE